MPPPTPRDESGKGHLVEQRQWFFFLISFLHTLWISAMYMLDALSGSCPSKCLGLEPKWRWPLWNSKSSHPTQSCLHPNGGVSWGLWEWTFFKYQHSPSAPQITMLSGMRVAVLSQKDNTSLPVTFIRSHSSIANGDILQPLHSGWSWWSHLCHKQRGQRSLVAISWTLHIRNCSRTVVLMRFRLVLSSWSTLLSSGRRSFMCQSDTLRSTLA